MNKNNVAVDVGDKGPSFSAGWNIYWSKFFAKQYGHIY